MKVTIKQVSYVVLAIGGGVLVGTLLSSVWIASCVTAAIGAVEWICDHTGRQRKVHQLAQKITAMRKYHAVSVLLDKDDELYEINYQLDKLAAKLKYKRRHHVMQKNTYLALTATINDGIIVINQRQQIVIANPKACQWLELSAFEGHPPLSEVIENLALKTMLQETLSSTQAQEKILRLASKNIRVQTLFVPVSAHHYLVLAMLYDYDAIIAHQRRQQALVANISHELKTPLTAISGFAETLKDGAINDLQTARQFVDIIAKQSQDMTALVNDLLTLSRLDNHADLALSHCQVRPLIASVASEFGGLAAAKNITIKLAVSQQFAVTLDSDKVKYVLRNLLQNAIRYNQENGQVKITAKALKNEWLLAVSDTGMGIAQKDLPHIFERFWRADESRARITGGSGLGLSIVADYVESMSGRIKVLSHPGVGTQFRVILPRFVMPHS